MFKSVDKKFIFVRDLIVIYNNIPNIFKVFKKKSVFTMNKEVYHDGWLIKSPPTKRIWRARWRRRWFTLKQGEIPGQFCLEYYTDRNCRKLKGVIDLDQCEQVDSGLRLEHRKQKFQNMFGVKTPRRIYYLAADSQDDMNDWVSCICQVCNLQDLSKQPNDRQYYNIGAEALVNKPLLSPNDTPSSSHQYNTSNDTNTSSSFTSSTNNDKTNTNKAFESIVDNTYQNDDFAFRNSVYTNRETLLCDTKLPYGTNQTSVGNRESKVDYYNFSTIAKEAAKVQTIERSQSMKMATDSPLSIGNHVRTQSLVDQRLSGTIRKIPENLNLTENFVDTSEPSPALSTCSGPYIPISECFSGSPIILDNDVPTTPLNSLDPRFYDTPRNHINIGLNLTNDQQYSPKRNNCPPPQPRPRSGRSSPTDSESVFTDDEEWTQPPLQGPLDRNLRPSDSSVENDSIVFTYAQRFSKMPGENKFQGESTVGESSTSQSTKESGPPRPPKQISGLLLDDGVEERNKETLSSDTENASPAIGPKDSKCCVEESYDIPRSHHLPYYNLNNNSVSPTLITSNDVAASSTPNLVAEGSASCKSGSNKSHFYTNAAPSKIAGNVFRYDFVEQETAPLVNRSLKPKTQADDKPLIDHKEITTESTPKLKTNDTVQLELRPPCIDRKLKPSTPKFDTNSLRRKGGPVSLSLSTDTEFLMNQSDLLSKTLPRNYNNPMTNITPVIAKPAGHLEYFDLDHSNPPPICNTSNSASTSSLGSLQRQAPGRSTTDISIIFAKPSVDNSGIVYKSVDFVKTEAIKRTRQDTELNRAKHVYKE